jgi:photosystem II stability/assembly factor-like uncharacterized protein
MMGYLESVKEQLAELAEQGAGQPGRQAAGRPRRRRPRRSGAVLAGAAALLVAAAVVAIALLAGSHQRELPAAHHRQQPHRHTHTGPLHRPSPTARATHRAAPAPSARASSAPAGPVPPGFAPQSFTAIGDLSWWLLGSAPCASPPCTSIVRTDDGGRTFVGIPAPRTSAISQLRFANADDGFAYGPQLWVTHDQGRSWHQVALGGAVEDLAASGGYVYAIVTAPDGSGTLMRSPVSRDAWSALPAAGDAYGGLWAQGSTVLLESASRTAQALLVSHDYGHAFAREPVPPSVACSFQEPQPPVVWAHCATGMLSGTWISSDGGARFRPVGAERSSRLPALPNSAAFAAASAGVAVVGYRQLYRTADGGASWAPVATPAGITWWRYLGFTDPAHGVAIGEAGAQTRLYYTTDGGLSYHLVAIR